LLEAVWLLTGGKSFRGGKDAELVRRGEPFAVLQAVTERADGAQKRGAHDGGHTEVSARGAMPRSTAPRRSALPIWRGPSLPWCLTRAI